MIIAATAPVPTAVATDRSAPRVAAARRRGRGGGDIAAPWRLVVVVIVVVVLARLGGGAGDALATLLLRLLVAWTATGGVAAGAATAATTAAATPSAGAAAIGGAGCADRAGFGGDADDRLLGAEAEEAALTLPDYLDVHLFPAESELTECPRHGVFDVRPADFHDLSHLQTSFRNCRPGQRPRPRRWLR